MIRMSNSTKRVGSQTIELKSKPRIIATYSVVGPREGQGPLKEYFDKILQDDCNGCESFEKAESSLMITAIEGVIKKGNVKEEDVDYLFSGDLLNQLTSTNFVAREFKIPFLECMELVLLWLNH